MNQYLSQSHQNNLRHGIHKSLAKFHRNVLIVQYLKAPLDKVWKIPTRLLVYIIALLVLLGAQAFTSGLALAAMGSYETTFARLG